MALIRCPECKRELSDKASACPNCGCPISGAGSQTFIDKDDKARCPNCGSSQISAQKEGFDSNKACCSALLVGPLGLLCGARKSNQLNGVCLKCGHTWIIQKDIRTEGRNNFTQEQMVWIIGILFILIIIGMCQK